MAGERVFLCPLTSERHYVSWQIGRFEKQDCWSELFVEKLGSFPSCKTSHTIARKQCKLKTLDPLFKNF